MRDFEIRARGMTRNGFCLGAVVLAVVLAVASAYAGDEAVARAMKLYEKRHYAEAAGLLSAELPVVEPARLGAARLTLGMIYLKNAELHDALYQESLTVTVDYLKRLASEQGKARSRYADLFLAEALIESGKPEAAAAHLEKIIADKTIEPRYQALAKTALGLCAFQRRDRQKAEELWSALDTADPEVKAALAAAFRRAGLREKGPAALADDSLSALPPGTGPSMRHLRNALESYAGAGKTDKGLDLVKGADLKAFSYREALSRSKVLTFYDVALLNELSGLYLQAGLAALEKAAEDAKLRDTARYYLAKAQALAGNVDQSVKTTASVLTSPQVPQQYRDKAMARQAANQHRKGRQIDAIGTWDELSKKQPVDPDLLAEILDACGGLRIECPTIAQRASAAVENGEGKRFSLLNVALGAYYFGRKDYARAITYLEAGRDKGNKNKIEANDPLMLVRLAGAYYRTKKFSEALEIYFEMSKQFPEVRQLQEALQGVYAMEHKSTGDVKIN